MSGLLGRNDALAAIDTWLTLANGSSPSQDLPGSEVAPRTRGRRRTRGQRDVRSDVVPVGRRHRARAAGRARRLTRPPCACDCDARRADRARPVRAPRRRWACPRRGLDARLRFAVRHHLARAARRRGGAHHRARDARRRQRRRTYAARAGREVDYAVAGAIVDRLDRLPLAIELGRRRGRPCSPIRSSSIGSRVGLRRSTGRRRASTRRSVGPSIYCVPASERRSPGVRSSAAPSTFAVRRRLRGPTWTSWRIS